MFLLCNRSTKKAVGVYLARRTVFPVSPRQVVADADDDCARGSDDEGRNCRRADARAANTCQ